MKTWTQILRILSLSGMCVLISCRTTHPTTTRDNSELQSEIDSYTPQTMTLDPVKSKLALTELDRISRIYLSEAVAWANSQPSCDSFCMALIVSETLAASQKREMAQQKLENIRLGNRDKRWGAIPPLPGWRGFFGDIESLLSKGKSADGRYTLTEGVLHFPLKDSVFRNLNRFDSPGSFLEVGAILPIFRDETSPPLFIGSDKFGHFLSTGFEYMETYQETFDDTLKAGLSAAEAEERALFAVHVRGLLTETTSLGGWIARVFSYGDLSANFDGFRFFKDIVDGRSPYLAFDKDSKRWQIGPETFAWEKLVQDTWDEGQNCSHYFDSVQGTNDFAHKIVAQLVELQQKFGKDVSCPSLVDRCQAMAKREDRLYRNPYRKALISPQCLQIADGLRSKPSFTQADTSLSPEQLDQKGFLAGETVVKISRQWCAEQRDNLVKKRCQSLGKEFRTSTECLEKVKRITSEGFRCAFDTQDFLGWAK